jgi:hypothetical protein
MHSSKKKLIEIPTELFDKIVRLASKNDRLIELNDEIINFYENKIKGAYINAIEVAFK